MSAVDFKMKSLERKLSLAENVSTKVHARHVMYDPDLSTVFGLDEYTAYIKPQEKMMRADAAMISDNAYMKKLPHFTGKTGDWELAYSSRDAFELMPAGGLKIDAFTIQRIVYYTEAIQFPYLRKGKTPWMSITPNEILTMDYELSRMRGNVFIGGLGMGYFLLMAAELENTNKIVVAELDRNVINLMGFVKEYCNRPERIEIIEADALDVIKSQHEQFDSFFIDVWDANPRETADVYIPFKDFGITKKLRNIHYWNEMIMREALWYDLFNYLRGAYYGKSFLNPNISDVVGRVLNHEGISLSAKGIDRLVNEKEAITDFYLQVLNRIKSA
jgi:hypothetical protein